jgi:hypothetical protein
MMMMMKMKKIKMKKRVRKETTRTTGLEPRSLREGKGLAKRLVMVLKEGRRRVRERERARSSCNEPTREVALQRQVFFTSAKQLFFDYKNSIDEDKKPVAERRYQPCSILVEPPSVRLFFVVGEPSLSASNTKLSKTREKSRAENKPRAGADAICCLF